MAVGVLSVLRDSSITFTFTFAELFLNVIDIVPLLGAWGPTRIDLAVKFNGIPYIVTEMYPNNLNQVFLSRLCNALMLALLVDERQVDMGRNIVHNA